MLFEMEARPGFRRAHLLFAIQFPVEWAKLAIQLAMEWLQSLWHSRVLAVVQLPAGKSNEPGSLCASRVSGFVCNALCAAVVPKEASARPLFDILWIFFEATVVHSLSRHVVGYAGHLVQDAGGVVGGEGWNGGQQEQGREGAAHLGNVAEGRTRRA